MIKIAYIPTLNNPIFDPRNIILYSKLKDVKINNFYENSDCDVLILPPTYDTTNLDIFKSKKFKIIYYIVDDYLSYSYFSIKNILRGFLYYATGKSKKLTLNYKKSQIDLCKLCDAVICGSIEQKKKIKLYNKNCYVFFEGNFHIIKSKVFTQQVNQFKIVWEGRSDNIFHLEVFKDAFKKLVKNYDVELHIITDLTYPLFNNYFYLSTIKKIKKIFGNLYQENIIKKKSHIYLYQWNKNTVSTILQSCDLSIIPLNKKNKLANGKSSNKLIHMMRNGLPTIATNINSYTKIYKDLKLDYSCSNSSEWYEKIKILIESKSKLYNFSEISKELIQKNYSEQKFIEQWDGLFKDINSTYE